MHHFMLCGCRLVLGGLQRHKIVYESLLYCRTSIAADEYQAGHTDPETAITAESLVYVEVRWGTLGTHCALGLQLWVDQLKEVALTTMQPLMPYKASGGPAARQLSPCALRAWPCGAAPASDGAGRPCGPACASGPGGACNRKCRTHSPLMQHFAVRDEVSQIVCQLAKALCPLDALLCQRLQVGGE